MQIVKGRKMKMVDVYTINGVDFLNEEEAIKFYEEEVLKEEKMNNQLLFEVSYAPVLQNKRVVYTRKIFISISKGELDSNVALITALNQISQKQKELFKLYTFKDKQSEFGFITADSFKVNRVDFHGTSQYNKITGQSYPVKGKFASVKIYKTNEHGILLSSLKDFGAL